MQDSARQVSCALTVRMSIRGHSNGSFDDSLFEERMDQALVISPHWIAERNWGVLAHKERPDDLNNVWPRADDDFAALEVARSQEWRGTPAWFRPMNLQLERCIRAIARVR